MFTFYCILLMTPCDPLLFYRCSVCVAADVLLICSSSLQLMYATDVLLTYIADVLLL
jgi:hypothetical protein